MPEGPEVKRNSIALSKAISGKDLVDFSVESGRYTRHELLGMKEFKELVPTRVTGVGCHGKFMYIIFKNGYVLWSTFGMSGVWSADRSKHTRLALRFLGGDSVFFNDIRNFGTAKLVYGSSKLIEKLESLGMDLLSYDVKPEDFILKLRTKDSQNICKVMMNQSVLAGVGNYIKAESLWMSGIDPREKVEDLEDFELLELKNCIEHVMRSSFENGGATFLTHKNFSGYKGNYSDRFLCYGRKIDAEDNEVKKLKTPDGRTTHWSPVRQRRKNGIS